MSTAFKLTADQTTAVALDYYWNEDMETCPAGLRSNCSAPVVWQPTGSTTGAIRSGQLGLRARSVGRAGRVGHDWFLHRGWV